MTAIVADLHSHAIASDGTDAPAQVARRAAAAGLRAFCLSDHDTVAGVAEASIEAARLGVEVVPGTELTCYVEGREVHVLGYGIDIHHPALLAHCATFQEARIRRAREIGERLAAAGVPVNMEAVMANADGGVVGRPHVAKALIEAGHVKDFQEAFDRFLADGRPACVGKMSVTAEECVEVIRDAGGVAVVAHPGLGKVETLIPVLLKAGAIGMEVWHSAHDTETSARLEVIANNRALFKTGGSDCHGTIKGMGPILGKWGMDEPRWKKFRAYLLENTHWGKLQKK